jgi:hypothetical protein
MDIMFQQNVYPPQHFTIQVPENGFREFLLIKKTDKFSLYDIQQQFFLNAGNKEGDDNISFSKNATSKYVASNAPVTPPPSTVTRPISRPSENTPTKDELEFIDNIELDNPHPMQRNNVPVDNTRTTTKAPLQIIIDNGHITVNNTDPNTSVTQYTRSEYNAMKNGDTVKQYTPPPRQTAAPQNDPNYSRYSATPVDNTANNNSRYYSSRNGTNNNYTNQETTVQPTQNSNYSHYSNDNNTSRYSSSNNDNNYSRYGSNQNYNGGDRNYQQNNNRNVSNENEASTYYGDCANPIDEMSFRQLMRGLNQLDDYEKKTNYCMNRIDNNCFTTTQLRTMALVLDNEKRRYVVLKKAYIHTTDKENFPLLISLFKAEEWQGLFRMTYQ